MFEKSTTFIISIFGVAWWLLLYLLNLVSSANCHMNYVGWCGLLSSLVETTAIFTVPFFGLLIISIITFRMRTDIYESWFRFARWWIPLSMLAIFLAPEYGSGLVLRVEKGSVALLFSAIFVIVSLIIITVKYFSLKRVT